ncbi:LCP family protein [Rhizomonospora bruguierae]|uniref:LCP family protein n=1 Tax=Rhizomonospora bruguierae TaxID=1581705 RepID=UPI0020C0CFC6|nr:LCP family protein [Micromonospora sp. NBRC 107566]
MGALLMITSGGAIAGGKVLISQATGGIAQGDLLGDAGKSDAEGGDSLDGPIDILLLGMDTRPTWDVSDARPDSIIALHIPASHDQAYLISLPRDTKVQVPGVGPAKLNESFFWGARNGGGLRGGTKMLAQVIKNLTGLSFDGMAIIDFGGFKKLVDALGGVHLCVDQTVTSHHMTLVDGKAQWNATAKKMGGKKEPVVYKPGCYDMEGWQALDYSRQRYGLKNGDYDRQRHQQQLLKAIGKKATSSGVITNPLKINSLIKAAGQSLVLDTKGTSIADFVFTLKGIAANNLITLRTNGGTFKSEKVDGKSYETLDETSVQLFRAVKEDKVSEFIIENPNVIAAEK